MTIKTFIKALFPKRSLPALRCVYFALFPWKQKPSGKGYHEFGYWETRAKAEGTLINAHYKPFYTAHFGLTEQDYAGTSILDIGCGPRGSLEWADMTKERVGLDPLADYYQRIGARAHRMRYVSSPCEHIPFPDAHFDTVSSFNSLDHVDNLEQTADEIVRVLKPGGRFLLLTDVNHQPTPTEPIAFSWDILSAFLCRGLTCVQERRYERVPEGLYQGIDKSVPYDHTNQTPRYGILSAHFIK
ncbi:class I SAM-dependent methyltransferase [Candidatus Uhrbacteria bacterium]|nr:class I SAM-dependent methyltransferase [Candidatus Uhrbacteria bacterium]